jgi:hypothetical protein
MPTCIPSDIAVEIMYQAGKYPDLALAHYCKNNVFPSTRYTRLTAGDIMIRCSKDGLIDATKVIVIKYKNDICRGQVVECAQDALIYNRIDTLMLLHETFALANTEIYAGHILNLAVKNNSLASICFALTNIPFRPSLEDAQHYIASALISHNDEAAKLLSRKFHIKQLGMWKKFIMSERKVSASRLLCC